MRHRILDAIRPYIGMGHLEGHIEVGSILCTDSHQSDIKFVEDFGLEHKRIESGKRRTDDFYNIKRLNSFHGRLKLWMSRFKEVWTKYLVNYLFG